MVNFDQCNGKMLTSMRGDQPYGGVKCLLFTFVIVGDGLQNADCGSLVLTSSLWSEAKPR
jgi:hypothetical protein